MKIHGKIRSRKVMRKKIVVYIHMDRHTNTHGYHRYEVQKVS